VRQPASPRGGTGLARRAGVGAAEAPEHPLHNIHDRLVGVQQG